MSALPPEAKTAIRKALLIVLEDLSETAYAAGHMMDLERDIWTRLCDYRDTGATSRGYGMEPGADLTRYWFPIIDPLASLCDWKGEDIDEDVP